MKGSVVLLLLVLWPMAGGFLGYIIGRLPQRKLALLSGSVDGKMLRDYFADFVVITEFLLMVAVWITWDAGDLTTFTIPDFCVTGLSLKLDGFRVLYGTITAFMWMMTILFSREYFTHYRNRNRYYLFNLLTLGATMGVFLSADLFTTFVFFELMSFTSYIWVVHDEKETSLRAGETYLAVAVIGGLVMLMGLFLLYYETGTLQMELLLDACKKVENKAILYAAGGCLLFGFGAKAGMVPLHIWLPKAHPVAPAPASALLSGILTKSGIFGILVISSQIFLYNAEWGMVILFFGVVTMLSGAILAVFSVDLKRTLACSSMSQIGFILVGIGMQGILGEENTLAVRGTLLHMVNHSLLKLVLFLVAGVVFMNLHQLNLNEIRGFGRKKPLLHFAFLMGALGIGGIPLWNGYISKTLLHESIVEYIHTLPQGELFGYFKTVEWLFLLAGGLTIAYMLKLYFALFWERNLASNETSGKYMNWQSTIAVMGSAILLPVLGMMPQIFMDGMASMSQSFLYGKSPVHAIAYFSWNNLKGACISIAIGVVVYFAFIRTVLMVKDKNGIKQYVDRWPKWADLENSVYRPIFIQFLPFVLALVCRIIEQAMDGMLLLCQKTILKPKKRKPDIVGNRFTYALGFAADQLEKILNKTLFRKNPKKIDFIYWLAERQYDVERVNRIITRSVSFGLLMFCVGLCLTLIYLLYL